MGPTNQDNSIPDKKLNIDDRKKELELEVKLLKSRVAYLEALTTYYKDYKLGFLIDYSQALVESAKWKDDYSKFKKDSDRINEDEKRLKQEMRVIEGELDASKDLLAKYKSLDPVLLAEYAALKENSELGEMLSEYSENNCLF